MRARGLNRKRDKVDPVNLVNKVRPINQDDKANQVNQVNRIKDSSSWNVVSINDKINNMTLVLDGNILTMINANKINELTSRRSIPNRTSHLSSEPFHSITIIHIKENIIKFYLYIKGVLHKFLIRIGLIDSKPDPILEEFKRFSLLYQMYCTSPVEMIAYHSAFGRAYYELKKLTEDPRFKHGNSMHGSGSNIGREYIREAKRIFSDFSEAFIW